jgi:hypothetical protein
VVVAQPVMGHGGGDRVLDLDRSAGRRNRRGEQRRDVSRPRGEEPDRSGATGTSRSAERCGAAGGQAAAGAHSAAGGGAAARSASESQRLGCETQRAERRDQSCELPADAAHASAELTAVLAIAQVAPGDAARTHAAVVGDDQLLADLRAGDVTRLERLREADARADQERLHRRNRDAERVGHVRVRHTAEFAHQQRGALLLREPAHVRDQAAQRFALLGSGDRIVTGGPDPLDHLRRRRRWAAELIDAAVVRDPIEPRPQGQLGVAGAQAGVRANEHLLESVLGIRSRAGQHLPRVREQPLSIPIVDRLECLVVPGAKELDQLLVGAQTQQRCAERDSVTGQTDRRLES